MWPMDELPEANVHSYIGVVVAVAGNILISVALNVQKYAHNELSLAASPSLEPKTIFHTHEVSAGDQHAGYTMLQDDMMLMESDDNSDSEANPPAASIANQTRRHAHGHRHSLSNTNSNTHSSHRASSEDDHLVPDDASSQSDISDTISQARPSVLYCDDDDDGNGVGDADNETRRRLLAQQQQQHQQHGLQNGEHANGDDDKESASSSNFDYLHSKAWWLGMVLMILGECGNFLAYGFAPASVVAPLGTVALISNVILAPLMLRERFRRRDLIGIVIAIIGAVVVVVNSKSDEVKLTPEAMIAALCQVQFVAYFFCSCIAVAILASLSDTIGPRYILVDLSIVAIFGGYTVLATKGVSSLLSLSFYKMFTYPISYLLVFVLVSTAVFQIKYLNKSLQRFDSTQVIPTQFVLFTISAIVGSAILYNDFDEMDFAKGLHFLTGCCMTFLGVYFITSHRDNLMGPESSTGNVQHHPEWILTPQDAFHNGPAATGGSDGSGSGGYSNGTFGSAASIGAGRYLYQQEPDRSDTLMEQGSYDPFTPSYRQNSFYGRPLHRPDSTRYSIQGGATSHNASTPLLANSAMATTKPDRTSTSLTDAGLSLASSVQNVLSAVGTRHQTALGLDKVVENYIDQKNQERRASIVSLAPPAPSFMQQQRPPLGSRSSSACSGFLPTAVLQHHHYQQQQQQQQHPLNSRGSTGNLLVPRDTNDLHYGTLRPAGGNSLNSVRPLASVSATALPLAMAGATPMVYSHSSQPYEQAAQRRSIDLSQDISRRGSLGHKGGGGGCNSSIAGKPSLRVNTNNAITSAGPMTVPTVSKTDSIQNTLVESPRSEASTPPILGATINSRAASHGRKGSKASLGAANRTGAHHHPHGIGHGVHSPSEQDFVRNVAHRGSIDSLSLSPSSAALGGTAPAPRAGTSGPLGALANRVLPSPILSSSPLTHSTLTGGPPGSSSRNQHHTQQGSEYAIHTLPSRKPLEPLERGLPSPSPPVSPLTMMFKDQQQQRRGTSTSPAVSASANATIPPTAVPTPPSRNQQYHPHTESSSPHLGKPPLPPPSSSSTIAGSPDALRRSTLSSPGKSQQPPRDQYPL